MTAKFVPVMLAVTQLMSWAATPLHLCIDKNGSVHLEVSSSNCNSCADDNHGKDDSEHATCCSHCEAEESGHAVVALEEPCGCTHIPLMLEQHDPLRVSAASTIGEWSAPVAWLLLPQEYLPRSIRKSVFDWNRQVDLSSESIALITTVLRC